MSFIERSMLLLFRNLKLLFFKYSSLYILYFYLLLLGKLLYVTYHIFNYKIGTLTCLYIVGLSLFLIWHRILSEKIFKIVGFSLFLVILCYLIYFVVKHGYLNDSISNLITALDLIYNRKQVSYLLIQQIMLVVIPFLVFLILYLDSKGKGGLTVLIFSLLAINASIYRFPKGNTIYLILYVYITFVYITIILYNWSKLKILTQKIKFSVQRNSVITSTLIFSLIITISGYSMVQVFGTANINDMIKKYQLRHVKYEENGKKSIYTISKSGFGSDKNLGGPITLNKNVAFRVKSDKPYYLRGIVKDHYDGHRWTIFLDRFFLKGNRAIFNPDDAYIKYMLSNRTETTNSQDLSKLNPKNITIYPETIISSTLFSPYNTSNVKSGRDYIGYTYAKTFMLLNKEKPENYYTLSFYESQNSIENFINGDTGIFSLDYNAAGNKSDLEYYNNNVKNVNDAYLQLPNNISKETYELVNDIVRGCTTTQEKILKIYNYLNSNYKYSTDVSPVPEGKEFLHHFLFNEKAGYCTYFATASVIFCRIAGVPARYVEGFNMKDIKDSNGLYIVSNDQAHAWAEILVSSEYNLWSVFDPVPSQDISNLNNDKIPENEQINKWAEENDSTTIRDEDNLENLGENKYYNEEIALRESRLNSSSLSKILLLLVLIVILSSTVYIFYRIRKYTILKATLLSDGKVSLLYHYSKQRLELLGFKSALNQSELDYIKDIRDPRLKEQLSVIVNLYHDEFFGEKIIKGFNKKEYYYFIEGYIKKHQTVFRYYLNKYFR